MDPKIQKVIDRVTKLRALATSQNAHEAAAAAAAAAKLMDEYRLSEAEIESAGGQKERASLHGDPIEESTGAVIPQWRMMLLSALGAHFGVYVVRDITSTGQRTITGKRKSASKVVIAGRPSDVEFVRYMYKWVGEEIERLCNREAPRGAGVAWRSTYRNGAAIGVGTQLRAMRAKERANQPVSRAMVLVDSRMDESKRAFALATQGDGRKVRNTSFCWGSDRGAYDRGKKAGEGINLSPHLSDGTTSGARQLKG